MKNPYNFTNKIALGIVLILFVFCFLSACKNDPIGNNPAEEEWISIFNGTNMADWTPKFAGYKLGENPNNRFVLKDQLLSVNYEPKDTFKNDFGHLFYKEKYSHYRLRAVYRFVGEQIPEGPGWAYRNNGLMLHCQAPETMGVKQDFPICIEVQLLGGNGTDERSTGNLCTPGSNVRMSDTLTINHCINSNSKTYHGDQWVTIDVLVLGDSLIQHIIGDEVVLEYTEPTFGGGAISDYQTSLMKKGDPIKEGYISIQAETHSTDFKSIELLNLCGCTDPKAKNYKSYFVKTDNSVCKY